MTTDAKPKRIYPSSSGFLMGRGVMTEYNSACLRYVLVASKQRGPDINQAYMDVGALHEDLYALKLGDRVAEREMVIKATVIPGVEYSGRCDFIDVDGVIHETKASFSESIYYGTINKGKYKLSHLAQLVSYFTRTGKTKGIIAVGYYERSSEGEYVQSGFRELRVAVRNDGAILVDDIPTGYTAQEQIAYQIAAATTLRDETIGERPINAYEYSSPCNYCPMNKVCENYDQGALSKEEFIEGGKQAIKHQSPMIPKINPIKKRRKKKDE